MADIFISYSSKDRAQAEQLTELLSSAGLSVWIDQSGIDVATSWSGEIVDAIEACKAFVVLLSPNSIASVNVVKEVSLAAEQRKKILPLDIEPVELPRDLKYHLAGLQRAPMTNIDSIIRTIGKLGLEATQAPSIKIVKETDSRKSLMILPFEDLSPTGDNGWFADGIVSELISGLSNVKSLRVIDAQTTKEFRSYKGQLAVYAREMGIRHFVQGDVRKFGDQIKIAARLLDIETGDHLWQDSLKGTMDEVFTIQENVAEKVVEGLKILLAAGEKEKIEEKPTNSPEAYEVYLKAREYFARRTRDDFDRALSLYEEAIRLDPAFASAHAGIASTCTDYYAIYGKNIARLDRAERAAQRIHELEGETPRYYWIMSLIVLRRGDAQRALELGQQALRIDPEFALGYEAEGFAYKALGQMRESIDAREQFVLHLPNSRIGHMNLIIALRTIGDAEGLTRAIDRGLPIFERHFRLNPDDTNAGVSLAGILAMGGRIDDALRLATEISKIHVLDGHTLYNLACVHIECHLPEAAIADLQRAVAKGFNDIEAILQDSDFDALRDTPEFNAVVAEIHTKNSRYNSTVAHG